MYKLVYTGKAVMKLAWVKGDITDTMMLGQRDIKLLISRASGLEDFLVDEPVLDGRGLRVTVCCACNADGQRLASLLDDYELAGSRLRVSLMKRGNSDHPSTSRPADPRIVSPQSRQTYDRWAEEPINIAGGVKRMPIPQDKIHHGPQHEQQRFAPQQQIDSQPQRFAPQQQDYDPRQQQHVPRTRGTWKTNTFKPVDNTESYEIQERLQSSSHAEYDESDDLRQYLNCKDEARDPFTHYSQQGLDIAADTTAKSRYDDYEDRPDGGRSILDPHQRKGPLFTRYSEQRLENAAETTAISQYDDYADRPDRRSILDSHQRKVSPLTCYNQHELETAAENVARTRYDDHVDRSSRCRSILDPHQRDHSVESIDHQNPDRPRQLFKESDRIVTYELEDKLMRSSSRISQQDDFYNRKRKYSGSSDDDEHQRMNTRSGSYKYVPTRIAYNSESYDEDRQISRRSRESDHYTDKARSERSRGRSRGNRSNSRERVTKQSSISENRSNSREKIPTMRFTHKSLHETSTKIPREIDMTNYPDAKNDDHIDERRRISEDRRRAWIAENEISIRHKEIDEDCNIIKEQLEDYYKNVANRGRYSEREQYDTAEGDYRPRDTHSPIKEWATNAHQKNRAERRKRSEERFPEYTDASNYNQLKSINSLKEYTELPVTKKQRLDVPSTSTSSAYHVDATISPKQKKPLLPDPVIVNTGITPISTGHAQNNDRVRPTLPEIPIEKIITPETMDVRIIDILKANPAIELTFKKQSSTDGIALHLLSRVLANKYIDIDKLQNKNFRLFFIQVFLSSTHSMFKDTRAAKLTMRQLLNRYELEFQDNQSPKHLNVLMYFARKFAFLQRDKRSFDSGEFWREIKRVQRPVDGDTTLELEDGRTVSLTNREAELRWKAIEAMLWDTFDNFGDESRIFQKIARSILREKVHSALGSSSKLGRQMAHKRQVIDAFRATQPKGWVHAYAKHCKAVYRKHAPVRDAQEETIREEELKVKDKSGREHLISKWEFLARVKAADRILHEVFPCICDLPQLFQSIAKMTLLAMMHGELRSSAAGQPWPQVVQAYKARQPPTWSLALKKACIQAFFARTALSRPAKGRFLRALKTALDGSAPYQIVVNTDVEVADEVKAIQCETANIVLSRVISSSVDLPQEFRSKVERSMIARISSELPPPNKKMEATQLAQDFKILQRPHWERKFLAECRNEYFHQTEASAETKEHLDKMLQKVTDSIVNDSLIALIGESGAIDATTSTSQGADTVYNSLSLVERKRARTRRKGRNKLIRKAAIVEPIADALIEHEDAQMKAGQPQSKAGQSQSKAAQPQSGDVQPQSKAGEPQRKASQPQSKAVQAQAKAEQVQTKAGQVQTKAGQPQTKAGQPQSKAGEPQSKASPPQSKVVQAQAKAEQVQAKAGQPQSKAGEPQSKAGQPQSKAEQIRAKAGQPQTKPGQPQTTAGRPQSKASQIEIKAELAQTKAGYPQSKAKQPLSNSGEHQSKAEQPQSKIGLSTITAGQQETKDGQPRSNNLLPQATKEKAIEVLEQPLNQGLATKTRQEKESISSAKYMVIAILRKDGAKVDAVLATMIRKRLIAIIEMAQEKGLHGPNCDILHTYLDPKGVFIITVGNEKARQWLLCQDFKLVIDIPLLVKKAGCVSLKLWLPGNRHQANPLEQLAWQNHDSPLKIKQWRLRSFEPSQNGVSINIVVPESTMDIWVDKPRVLFYQGTKVTAEISDYFLDDDFIDTEGLITETIKQEIVQSEIAEHQTAEVAVTEPALSEHKIVENHPAISETIEIEPVVPMTAENATVHETFATPAKAAPETTGNDTKGLEPTAPDTTEPETDKLRTVVKQKVVHENTAANTVQSDTAEPKTDEFETVAQKNAIHENAIADTVQSDTAEPKTDEFETVAQKNAIADTVQSDTAEPKTDKFDTVAQKNAVHETAVTDHLASEIATPQNVKPKALEAETTYAVSNETAPLALKTNLSLRDQNVKEPITEVSVEPQSACDNSTIVNQGLDPPFSQ